MARYEFNQIFKENPNGTLTPTKTIDIRGAVFGSSVTFGPGVAFGGIDIFKLKDHAIEADEENGILIIRGFYHER